MPYFMLSAGDRGIMLRAFATERELLDDLHGQVEYLLYPGDAGMQPEFHSTLPHGGYISNQDLWDQGGERGCWLIKGKIIVPKAIEVVRRYVVE
jgi:hypothetical protein